jgi:hypothetical protein
MIRHPRLFAGVVQIVQQFAAIRPVCDIKEVNQTP